MYAQLQAGYNNGYAEDQVADASITVGELLRLLQEAVQYGEVTEEDRVVLRTPGRYGANHYSITGLRATGGEGEEDDEDL